MELALLILPATPCPILMVDPMTPPAGDIATFIPAVDRGVATKISPLLLVGVAGTNFSAPVVIWGCDATPITNGLREEAEGVLTEDAELQTEEGPVSVTDVTGRLEPTAAELGIV